MFDAKVFIVLLGLTKAEGKQSSIITIFSLWNTMLGTSLLSMPWALQQACSSRFNNKFKNRYF